jgi:hypothetical protein
MKRAGYSGTPLVRKLGIKEGHLVAALNAPEGFPALLEPPASVRYLDALTGDEPFDVIVLFVKELAALEAQIPEAAGRLQQAGGLWVGWAKKSSPLAGELTGDLVRAAGLAAGLVDNKVCAIDQDWSGLRFVYRLEDRT